MKCIQVYNSYIGENTYLIGDDECYVIDPGSDGKKIDKEIQKNFKGVKAILLTHAHLDHIMSVDYLVDIYHCKVYMSPKDQAYVDGSYSTNYMMRNAIVTLKCETTDIYTLPDKNVLVYETPGHSKGSVCLHFVNEQILFTGDTLFYMSIGRTDLPGGSQKEMIQSLRFIKTLPDNLKVYPGHEQTSILEFEKKHNMYLSQV